MRENIEKLQEDLRQADVDLDEMSGEKNQKYKELKKREETMNQFLDTYDESYNAEVVSVLFVLTPGHNEQIYVICLPITNTLNKDMEHKIVTTKFFKCKLQYLLA